MSTHVWRLMGAVWLLATASNPLLAQSSIHFKGDVLARQEWTENLFSPACAECHTVGASRRGRIQFRPRIEVQTSSLRLIVGAELNYSSDRNAAPTDVALPVRPIRDNYKSRDSRLDLASVGVNLLTDIEVDAGRLPMPFKVTEMVWDRDLRVQGAVAKWSYLSTNTGLEKVRLSALYSRGSHVFKDSAEGSDSLTGQGTTLAGGSLDLSFGSSTRTALTASYLRFDRTAHLDTLIRRQNTRTATYAVARGFGIIDLVGRLRMETRVPLQLVVNYAINHRTSVDRAGLWAALVVGPFPDARVRGEYTYASVDRDLTVAAYAGDDFFWGTGWDGHRLDLAFEKSSSSSFHVVGQLQRFKETADPLERAWIGRLRLEARKTF